MGWAVLLLALLGQLAFYSRLLVLHTIKLNKLKISWMVHPSFIAIDTLFGSFLMTARKKKIIQTPSPINLNLTSPVLSNPNTNHQKRRDQKKIT